MAGSRIAIPTILKVGKGTLKNLGKYIRSNGMEHAVLYFGNGLIDIDCGCGNKTELRRLACLRLDDLKEFYI